MLEKAGTQITPPFVSPFLLPSPPTALATQSHVWQLQIRFLFSAIINLLPCGFSAQCV